MIDVLLIEDEEDLGLALSKYIQYKGIHIQWTKNIEDATKILNQQSFKLVIIDVQLPDGNGFILAEQILKDYAYQPIFFLTAKQERTYKLKGLSLGAIDYITKPFDMDEVLLKIKNVLSLPIYQESNKKADEILTIGKFKHHTLKYKLTDGEDNTQKMTIRESEVLRYLIQNKNSVVPKKDLLMQFWGNTDYFNGKSLEVFISRIRKQLQSDDNLKIESIYGSGYILHEHQSRI
ncbi:MAG: DNA-binding response regulator [Pseudopedobacter saltans]|uniref:DNA-binding response regulator n=1 Tax=Pseudopedobacter saltans TaxID=151895 RepID=A0A2W5ED67_9SPHI|nr:MAG: DNA-binding response regulator [Pseudopedobacter saltans]